MSNRTKVVTGAVCALRSDHPCLVPRAIEVRLQCVMHLAFSIAFGHHHENQRKKEEC